MDSIEQRLEKLGYRFEANPPARAFERVKIVGDIAYVSGHGPTDENGDLVAVGRVGSDVTLEVAREAARRVAVNCLGSLKEALGSLDRIAEIIKVLAFVNSAPQFHQQPEVVNGFTDLMIELLGDRGRHARSSIGTSNLPANQPVEIEMIVRVR